MIVKDEEIKNVKDVALKKKWSNIAKVFLLLSVILSLFLCSQSMAKGPSPLNILLITIDTIRADHIGCYGYEKIKTPNIDQLARKGILFENAFTPIPITLPSHASILTGTYPTFHGVRNNGTYAMPESVISLAEILKEKGYVTAAFVSAYVMDKRFGLDQGFDVYNDDLSGDEDRGFLDKERRAEAVTQATIKWLKEANPAKFFLWVHYFDPHMHYNPPPPFSEEYKDNLYDGEIAYTDHWLGILLNTMHQLGLDENTLIVLTGDHGEGLGEHKEKTHGIFIYDTTLQVPLILTYPKLFPHPKRIEPLVRLIDIAPTILDLAEYKPYKDMQGISLIPVIQGKVDDPDLVLYCESFYPKFSHNWSPLEGLRTQKWKYIEAPVKELYRVDKDPQEKTNVFEKKQGEAKKLASKLSGVKNSITSSLAKEDAQRVSLDKETREKLQSLGYIFTPTGSEEKEKYPDPKKMIDALEYIDNALEYFGKGEYQKALEQFQRVLERHPRDVDTHNGLGHTYAAMGNVEKSIESFEKALEFGCKDLRVYIKLGDLYMKSGRDQEWAAILREALEVNPECKEAYINLSRYHFQKNQMNQALEQLQKVLEIDPRNVTAHNHLAVIYLRQRRYDQATSACRTALNEDPNNVTSLLTLGSTFMYQQRYEDALGALQKALEIKSGSARGHYFAGLVTFQQNELDKAIKYFKRAGELDPNWAEPHFNLGFIYQRQKRLNEALREYQTTIKLNPKLFRAQEMIEKLRLQIRSEKDI
jgi:arylsulfatase A-like enzyme/Tfp pilus assembly protein PilF